MIVEGHIETSKLRKVKIYLAKGDFDTGFALLNHRGNKKD
jgi:hypothetical protein